MSQPVTDANIPSPLSARGRFTLSLSTVLPFIFEYRGHERLRQLHKYSKHILDKCSHSRMPVYTPCGSSLSVNPGKSATLQAGRFTIIKARLGWGGLPMMEEKSPGCRTASQAEANIICFPSQYLNWLQRVNMDSFCISDNMLTMFDCLIPGYFHTGIYFDLSPCFG